VRELRQERTIGAAREFAAGSPELRPLNDEWDRKVLRTLASGDLESFDSYSDESVTSDAGRAGHEIRSWIAALAAQRQLGAYRAEILLQRTVPEWIVGMGAMWAQAANT
jgi:2,3-dihydroxyphenylpropionate 1,2-dioxygenase